MTMGRNSNSASSNVLLVHLLFLVLVACFPSFSFTQSPIDPCSLVQCGQGSCKVLNSFPFFKCDCYQGWTKPQFLTTDLPFCIIPNCSIDMKCGDTDPPPPPPPPAPIVLPPLNITDPCFLVWCGDGRCVHDGVAHNHTCVCNDGSNNFLSQKGLPCFKECSLGADCEGVSFGRPSSPPQLPPAPGTSSGPPKSGKGSGSERSYWRNYGTFLLAGVAFVWM